MYFSSETDSVLTHPKNNKNPDKGIGIFKFYKKMIYKIHSSLKINFFCSLKFVKYTRTKALLKKIIVKLLLHIDLLNKNLSAYWFDTISLLKPKLPFQRKTKAQG